MVLVDYGSSDSEQEQTKPSAPPKTKQSTSNKPAFEKLVDKSNPGKIRLNIAPESLKETKDDSNDEPEPPAKRAKTGGFSGFNSLLPAPKRATGTAPGLKKGVSLKTGSEPGFTRERMPETPVYDPSQQNDGLKPQEIATRQSTTIDVGSKPALDITSETTTEIPAKKRSTIFKPLSVARKPQKKKNPPTEGQSSGTSTSQAKTQRPEAAPKVSLFSVENVSDTIVSPPNPTGTYQPLVYQPNDDDTQSENVHLQSNPQDQSAYNSSAPEATPNGTIQADSLDGIAADLNLSASARRQLLGRNQRDGNAKSIKITNFNTDQEYAANEVLRQSGEIVQHNAVRGIAPGKHSLKQLVNAATTQKDALEEQFAAGRRNKSEAGARYGW